MRIVFTLAVGFFLFTIAGADVAAQKRKITVIIFRHADKELPTEGDDSEPDISIEGQRRALRLVKVLKKYKPLRLFSTNYARTIQTVTPLARIKNLPIEFYEPGKLDELVKTLLSATKRRRFVVVGHNSTSFQLVNLLLKQGKYKMPPDSEYGQIWIVRIKNGRVSDEVISY